MTTRLISWNVNGIRAVIKKDLFFSFIETHKPDILCLQETKAQKEQVALDLPNYFDYWHSAEKKGYSGTAIFSKEKPLSVVYGFLPSVSNYSSEYADSYGDPEREGRVITAEFEKFFVVTVYTPNAKDDLSRVALRLKWDAVFLRHCQELEKTKPVLFCGDFNVAFTEEDLARPKENIGKKGFTSEERAGFEAFVKADFVDTFRISHTGNGYYTWWANWGGARERNVGWRIDYVMASKSMQNNIQNSFILPEVYGSDHCPVGVDIEV
jgi:exodeoxyribonuclease III